MIIVKLKGGLGNQMFQYALGRRLALLHNTELRLDVSEMGKDNSIDTLREYELNVFGINLQATENELAPYKEIQQNRVKRKLQKLLPDSLLGYHIINEPSHAFHPEVLKSPDNSYLTGFWQTEQYFSEIASTIRTDFTFKHQLDKNNQEIADRITSCNSVGLHIRRGDYISNPVTQNYHGNCGVEYYKEAIKMLNATQKELKLFIFSDEPEWVKQNMKFYLPAEYIMGNTGKNGYIDMQLMSLCKHNVIANSSFSWWAAWLNTNINKTVIVPAKWFNDSSIETKDIIPEGWIKI